MLSSSHVFLFLVTVFSFLSAVSSIFLSRVRLPLPFLFVSLCTASRSVWLLFALHCLCPLLLEVGRLSSRLFESTVFSVQASQSHASALLPGSTTIAAALESVGAFKLEAGRSQKALGINWLSQRHKAGQFNSGEDRRRDILSAGSRRRRWCCFPPAVGER
jgi:hypothetical protein